MRKAFVFSFVLVIAISVSCTIPAEKIKEDVFKIFQKKKTEVDSTINKEIDNSLNKVDTLLNLKKD